MEPNGLEPILLYLLKHSLIQRHESNIRYSRTKNASKRPPYQPLTMVLKWKERQYQYQHLGKEIVKLCQMSSSLIPISNVQIIQNEGKTVYTLECFGKWTMEIGLVDQGYYLDIHFPHSKRIEMTQLKDLSTFFYSEMMRWVLYHVCDLVNDSGLFTQPWECIEDSVVGCFNDSKTR
jgi:hypothetical protein